MSKIIIIIVVAIVAIAGYLLFKSPSMTPTSDLTLELAPVAQEMPSAEQNVIIYADAGYSPTSLSVKTGATVTFKNEGSQAMWPASAIHPTHKIYPTTGGCIGSTFDACEEIQPGDSWSFQFDIAGTWKYHDHLNPSSTGIIVVE